MDIDWKGIVKNVAPVLGTALGGPMAGAAVRYLATELLGNADATERDVEEYIASASPDSLIKLRELDYSFQTKMKELDVDVFRVEVEDKKSARELAQYNMRPHIILSALFMLGYFVILYLMMTGDLSIDADMKAEANLVLGVLTVGVANILQFWFGSSMGSKEKTRMIPD